MCIVVFAFYKCIKMAQVQYKNEAISPNRLLYIAHNTEAFPSEA